MTHLPPPPAGREQTALLLLTLETAVPMWAVTVASWPAGRRARAASARAQAAAGDTARGYRPAEVCTAIAKGLGIGACQPGGVTWFGRHWCTAPHGTCPGVIPASLLPEPRLTVTRLADDPLGTDHGPADRTLLEAREDLGSGLAAVLPAEVVRVSRL